MWVWATVGCQVETTLPPVEVPADAPFVQFRIGGGGFCQAGVDCTVYKEVWGEGTFRTKAYGNVAPEEWALSADDLTDLTEQLTAEAFVDLLRLGDVCSTSVVDASESMVLETWDERIVADTTLCSDVLLDEIRDTMYRISDAGPPAP